MTDFLRTSDNSAPITASELSLTDESAALGLVSFDFENGLFSGIGNTIHLDSGDETVWTDVQLNCTDSDGCIQINGSGVSVCNGQAKPFILLGEYMPHMGAGRLQKLHVHTEAKKIDSPIQYLFIAKPSRNSGVVAKLNLFNDSASGVLRILH